MPRQSDLHFTFEPLQGDAFEVVSFKLDEGLSQPFKLKLELASHDNGYRLQSRARSGRTVHPPADAIGTGNPFADPQPSPVPLGAFLGRYTLLKNNQRAFAGYRYRITDGAAVLAEGLTRSSGETDWATTEATQSVRAHKAIMRDDQRITEAWQSNVAATGDQVLSCTSDELFQDDFLDQHTGDLD